MDNNRKHNPDNPQNQGAGEGDYKNIETSVNTPSYFDDSNESQAEDKLTMNEPDTEKEQQDDQRGRA